MCQYQCMTHYAYNNHLRGTKHKYKEKNINQWTKDKNSQLDKTFNSKNIKKTHIWEWDYFYAWAMSKKNNENDEIDENENN